MQKVKSFFKQFDLFSALPTLRAKSSPETNNTCGGILSVLVLIGFAYLFIDQFVKVTNWEKISFIESQSNDLQTTRVINQFAVGIGVEGFNLTQTYPFLRFQFRQITMNGTNFVSVRSLQKEECRLDHWSALGNEAEKSYKSFNVKDKVCLKPGQNISIQQASTGVYKILSITVNDCRMLDQSDQPIYTGCASQQQFSIGNAIWIRAHKYFTATTVFINTGFTPNNKKAASKYMDIIRSTFTITRGTECIAYLSPYQIITDISILPFQEAQTQSGYKLDQYNSENFQSIRYFENINIYWILSAKSLQINRTVGKVDEVLSYAGGLFGIIVSILAIFMMSFNEYRYELMVGEGAFNYSDDGSKVREHDFNFLQYVRYCAWDWVKTLTCVELDWKKCREIDETREEANNQLDVTLLFKKIQHFERVIEYIISDKENIGLYLTEPPSIEEVRRTRQIAEYYEKVIKGKSATTVEDIQQIENILMYALDQNSRTDLVLASSVSKRKLNEQPVKSRQDILDKVLNQFKLDDDIEDVDLDQEQLKVQQQIAEAFFRMAESARRKIQQKIPLKILHRLKRKYESKISQQTMAINLEI